jgi:hypothetical protein
VKNHGLNSVNATDEHLKSMKDLGVVPLRTPTVNLLPRETIEALVKVINTEEAWAAYRQLWKIARGEETSRPLSDNIGSFIQATEKLADVARLLKQDVEAVKADADSSPFTTPQVTELLFAMKARVAAPGLHGKARGMSIGSLKGAVKRQFLPAGTLQERTWNTIERRHFHAVKKFITEWLPAGRTSSAN